MRPSRIDAEQNGGRRGERYCYCFVDENDYREISAKAVSAKRKLKNSTAGKSLTHLIFSQDNLQFEERNFWFNIYSFISLLLFNKNDTWRPTFFIVQTTADILQIADVALRVVFLLFLPCF